jgi:hypothetical protein
MKTKLRSVLLISTLIITSTLGCKKKSDEQPTTIANCETKYEVFFDESAATSSAAATTYESGQIKTLNSGEGIYDYTYTANQVTVSVAGVAYYRIDITNGLASKITDLNSILEQRLSYDGNRNLVKIETYSQAALTDTKTLSYNNGNLVTLSQTYPESPDVQKITTYSHSTEVAGKVESETRHLFFSDIDPFLPTFLTGTTSKNRITSSRYVYIAGTFHYESDKTYTYTGNGNATPSKIIEDTHTVAVGNGTTTLDERIKKTLLITSSCD